MKTRSLWVGALILVIGGFWLGKRGSEEPLRPVPMPPVLERVQALGDLHSARYTYQNVFEHATALKAADWAQGVPGVNSLVRATTRNTALVQVSADVEAGVDLSKAEMNSQAGLTHKLVLPHARVYPPHVDARVHGVRTGMLWRDDNLALDAERDAADRLKIAAVRQGILETAEANAVKQIQRLVPGNFAIEFR